MTGKEQVSRLESLARASSAISKNEYRAEHDYSLIRLGVSKVTEWGVTKQEEGAVETLRDLIAAAESNLELAKKTLALYDNDKEFNVES